MKPPTLFAGITQSTNPGTTDPAAQAFAPPSLHVIAPPGPKGLPKEARGDTAVGNPDINGTKTVTASSGALRSASGETFQMKNLSPRDLATIVTAGSPMALEAFGHEAQHARVPGAVADVLPIFSDVDAGKSRPETGLAIEVNIK